MSGIGFDLNLPPKEAIAFFKDKGFKIGFDWHEVWEEAHAKSFTVAGIMKMDILQDVHYSLVQNIAKGETFSQWKDSIVPYLNQRGYIGTGEVVDTKTGVISKQIAPYRLETIYRTNVQSSMMAGRWASLVENAKYRPYLEYVAIMDNRTRPAHAQMNGIILPIDDPFWQNFYPPNGWGCRCTIRSRSEKDIERKGLEVHRSTEADYIQYEQPINKEETRPATAFKHPKTGQQFTTDAGFGFNAGKSRYIPNLDKYHAPIAQEFIKESIAGPDFKYSYKKFEKAVQEGLNKGLSTIEIRKTTGQGFKWPVARIEDNNLFSSETKTIILSDDTLIKQIAHRQDKQLQVSDYLLIQETIENAELIIQSAANTVVFIKKNGVYYQAVVKSTKDKKELYMTSFRRTNPKAIKQEMKKGEIMKNTLEIE